MIALTAVVLLFAPAAQGGEAPVQLLAGIQDRIARSDLAGARTELDAAARQYPRDGRIHNMMGILAAQSNEYARAEAAFREALRLSPRLTGAWLNLGRLYQTHVADDPKAAGKGIEVYRRLLAAQPDLAEANYQLALLLAWDGAWADSARYLDRLPPEDRDRPGALGLRCAVEAGRGNVPAGMAAARRLLDMRGLEEADVLAILPLVERAKRDEVSRVLLEGAAEKGMASPESLSHLAGIYEGSGGLARARATLEAAAKKTPGAVRPLMDLARVAWKQKDYEGTLGYLAHARDIEPRNAAIHFLFGLAANELHLAAEARQSLQKAIEFAPDHPYYNYAMGVVALQWADKQPAIPYLKKYAAARPDDARGQLALATAYFLLYDFDAARSVVSRVADAPEVKAPAQYLLGCIARESGDSDAALKHLRTALELAPGMTDAHGEIASVLARKEDYGGAEREARIVLAKDPGNFNANQILLQVYRNTQDPRTQQQAERLKTLAEDRGRRTQQMLRTIEVRPY